MWFIKTYEEVLKNLDTNFETGLSTEEVSKRQEKYGKNKLKGKPSKSIFSLFIGQLKDMLIYILLGATLLTMFIGEYIDAIIILFVIILNAIIGVFQEYKAEKAVEALEEMTIIKTLVKRNGEVVEINSEELVPGDIVILDAGRFVPADIRLIKAVNLQIEESTLTGESVPVEKDVDVVLTDEKTPIGDRTNMAYMSTLVTYGRGEGIVVETGMDTEIGKIARILDEHVDDMTPLQIRLDELGKTLGFIAMGICILIFIIALIQKRDLFEMFLLAISLAVAAIPEGLAAIVAIVLALGVTRMSKKNAIIKKLPAVETLGSVNIICSDKTGTLTQNKMTVVQLYTLNNLKKIPDNDNLTIENKDEEELLKTFILSSDAVVENGESIGDPTEIALVVLGDKHNLSKRALENNHERVNEKPFDSDRKLMSTLNKFENGYKVNTKGAIDNILKISTTALVNGEIVPLTDEMRDEYLKISEQMSNEALRVLGAAFKNTDEIIEPEDMEKDLTVIGIVGMIDPPRLEVKDSIREAKMAGITPVMITGDHKNTAMAIAKELGIAESMEEGITGFEIDQLSDEEFSKNINKYKVFARVSPEHKVKIVKAYKSHDNIVSMTGDGVNDAPSLKNADIGVAMGITGTDVSKAASDMILTDDNFTTIVHAIEEGRNIYNNIKKSVVFLLSCNLGEVISILMSVLFYWPIPLLPTHILWVNLITDSLPAIALGVDTNDKDVMKQKPRDPKESFFAGGTAFRAIVGGTLIGTLTLVAFYLGLNENGYTLNSNNTPETVLNYARTMAFVVLATSQLFYSLSIRSNTKSIFQVGIFTNKHLIMAIVGGFILQLGVVSIPFFANIFKLQNLSIMDWGLVIFLSLIPLIVNELLKIFLRRTKN